MIRIKILQTFRMVTYIELMRQIDVKSCIVSKPVINVNIKNVAVEVRFL